MQKFNTKTTTFFFFFFFFLLFLLLYLLLLSCSGVCEQPVPLRSSSCQPAIPHHRHHVETSESQESIQMTHRYQEQYIESNRREEMPPLFPPSSPSGYETSYLAMMSTYPPIVEQHDHHAMTSTYPPVVEQHDAEKQSLESEVAMLRDQLAQSRAVVVLLSSRVANLEEEIAQKDAFYANTNAAQFVEVEVATPVLHVQARPMIIDSAHDEDEEGHASPHHRTEVEEGHASPHHRTEILEGEGMAGETVSGLAYAHRIAKRGAVKIICQTGSPITAMWMTNEVTCGSLVNLGK